MFLLSGIGVLLTMLTYYLARIARARMEEQLLAAEKAKDVTLTADFRERLNVQIATRTLRIGAWH